MRGKGRSLISNSRLTAESRETGNDQTDKKT